MGREALRRDLVPIIGNKMGLDISTIAWDDADFDGYYNFVLDKHGKKVFDSQSGECIRVFIPWTAEQLEIIHSCEELFSQWFYGGIDNVEEDKE